MKQLVLLSGKGGTGKTTVSASFVALAHRYLPAGGTAFADCDVDAPNLHLVFSDGASLLEQNYYGVRKAVINQSACTRCGVCEQHCRLGAIRGGVVNPYLCDGCGVCGLVCPVSQGGAKAVKLEELPSGRHRVAQTSQGLLSTARLRVGAGSSGKLVSQVKGNLSLYLGQEELAVVDGSPGIGCQVISALSGADLALVVSEPTLSALSDLRRVVSVIRGAGVPAAVCINKADLGGGCAQQLRDYCLGQGLELLGEIPCDPAVVKAINHGRPVVDYPDSPAGAAIRQLFFAVLQRLELSQPQPSQASGSPSVPQPAL